jgi:hypothetical protein
MRVLLEYDQPVSGEVYSIPPFLPIVFVHLVLCNLLSAKPYFLGLQSAIPGFDPHACRFHHDWFDRCSPEYPLVWMIFLKLLKRHRFCVFQDLYPESSFILSFFFLVR